MLRQRQESSWQETAAPIGPVPNWLIEETQQDLSELVSVLQQLGVEVLRPTDIDFVARDGLYNYCPRDRLLIAGSTVVDPAMLYPCRDLELDAYRSVVDAAEIYLHMPRHEGLVLDAANVCRMDDHWLFLESASGNRAAHQWLCDQFPEITIELCNFYAGVHIDSTVVALRPGLVMLNASRVTPANCPRVFDGWDKIWIDDCVPQTFYQYPYASKWIGMNCLSVSPDTVIVDAAQTNIIRSIEQRGMTVIPLTLRHSRTLGGGFHCVTLDLWRQHD